MRCSRYSWCIGFIVGCSICVGAVVESGVKILTSVISLIFKLYTVLDR